MASPAGICTAIGHTGVQCSSLAHDSSGLCTHHARMARVMALASKSSSTSKASTLPSSSSSSSELLSSSMSLSPPSVADDHPLELLPGETLLARVSCSFLFPPVLSLPDIPGTLFITSFRLRFVPHTSSLRPRGAFHRLLDRVIHGIPRAAVARLSYPQATVAASRSLHAFTSSSPGTDAIPSKLVLKCKDLTSWMFGGDVTQLLPTLNRYVFIDSPLNLFAFTSMPSSPDDLKTGHAIYHLDEDFARMGVSLGAPTCPYRVTTLNRSFTLCPTYPRELIVPAAATDADVTAVASFRSKGRFPICTYVHARTGAALWRCAQPKRGILHAQNAADAQYLVQLGQGTTTTTTSTSSTTPRKIWIADCRPELNARVNNLTGGGTESANLAHARVSFLNIGNIHAMRESLEAVRSLGHVLGHSTENTLDFAWGSRVEETKWLVHVRRVLSGAFQVARALDALATTVLVHCSDGWDRTAQLCGLAQVLVDPHYRTRRGFLQVIEKEWVRAGHQFQTRVAPGKVEDDDDQQQAPIFLQFVDCIWQLRRLFPTYFEFNDQLLETMADALVSGQYGTFLGNCERERSVWKLRTRTPSLYAVLLQEDTFLNPFYRPTNVEPLLPEPSSVLRHVTLWSSYYLRSAPFLPVPVGNPSPPLYALDKDYLPVASSAQEDLELAMKAALRRIQELEKQVETMMTRPDTATAAFDTSIGSSTPRRLQALTQATTWTCSICTKTNEASVLQCIVCGRAPR